MNVPELSSASNATSGAYPLLDKVAAPHVVVILKQRFKTRGSLALRVPGAKIELVDVPWTSAPTSGIKRPGDLCLKKPGTDVLVVGDAVAPGGTATTALDARVRVDRLEKTVRVFGPRLWYSAVGSVSLSPPRPFLRQPIRWEFAFGGSDFSDPKRAVQEPLNPIGIGLASRPEKLVNTLAPHVEDPTRLLRGAGDRPPPAGFAPLGPHFQQRLRHAGTANQKWQDEHSPNAPLDADDRFNQLAVPELIATPHLKGGERVEVTGMRAAGPWVFHLPTLHFGAEARGIGEARPVLDTVCLYPNEDALELTWRAAFRNPERGPVQIRVFEKERAA